MKKITKILLGTIILAFLLAPAEALAQDDSAGDAPAEGGEAA